MNIGKVVKKVISTIKHTSYQNLPLLIVQPLDINLLPKGAEVLAIDFVGADVNEIVLLMKEGSSVQQMLNNKEAPADAAIVGIIDEIELHNQIIFKK